MEETSTKKALEIYSRYPRLQNNRDAFVAVSEAYRIGLEDFRKKVEEKIANLQAGYMDDATDHGFNDCKEEALAAIRELK